MRSGFGRRRTAGKELWACCVEHAVAATTIWVIGADHRLRCSTDRGHNWSDGIWTTNPAPGAMLTSLDFADWALHGKDGVVGTNSGELFFATDGMTWTAATINGWPPPSSLLATNSMAAIQSCSKRRMVVPRVGSSPMLQGAYYSWAGVEILGATSVIVVGKKISTNQAAAFVSYDARLQARYGSRSRRSPMAHCEASR